MLISLLLRLARNIGILTLTSAIWTVFAIGKIVTVGANDAKNRALMRPEMHPSALRTFGNVHLLSPHSFGFVHSFARNTALMSVVVRKCDVRRYSDTSTSIGVNDRSCNVDTIFRWRVHTTEQSWRLENDRECRR